MRPEHAANFDQDAGIYYGVISQHTITPESLEDVCSGESLTYLEAVANLKAKLRSALSDDFSDYRMGNKMSHLDQAVEDAFDAIEQDWNDRYEAQDEQYRYESDGLIVENSPSLFALYVIKSPYYTFARRCSPCCPNAGDLDCTPGPVKCYCLPVDWFDEDKPPYHVYRVDTDELVYEPEAAEGATG